MDERIKKLADVLVNYSTAVKPGENVLIEYRGDEPVELITAIVNDVYKAGGNPFVNHTDMRIHRALLLGCNPDQIKMLDERDYNFMKQMDCYIAVSSYTNSAQLSDVPVEKMQLYSQGMDRFFTERVNNSRWVIARYPNPGMAQQANMSLEAFTDFYFNVCTLDYSKMDKAFFNWMDENCAEYGFIKRYPSNKADITGWDEPWHFRYVGVEAAKEIAQNGLTLEEYLGE